MWWFMDRWVGKEIEFASDEYPIVVYKVYKFIIQKTRFHTIQYLPGLNAYTTFVFWGNFLSGYQSAIVLELATLAP